MLDASTYSAGTHRRREVARREWKGVVAHELDDHSQQLVALVEPVAVAQECARRDERKKHLDALEAKLIGEDNVSPSFSTAQTLTSLNHTKQRVKFGKNG
eukprot:4337448-Heterocapsa_arctica.AAC.1